MTVRLFTPSTTHNIHDVSAVDVESLTGRHTLLPRHVDCTAALATGLVMLRTTDDEERHVGVDGGTLVKIGQRIMISTPRVALDEELGALRRSLEARRQEREEHNREAQQALARLEIELARSIFGAEAGR